MKKVGIIVSDITKSAGTERAVVNLANCLCADRKTDVSIISLYTDKDAIPYYEIDNCVDLVNLQMTYSGSRSHRLLTYRNIRKELRRIIVEKNIDILIGTTHAYNILISTLDKVATIGCEHINYEACPKVIRPIRRLAYKRLSAVVVLTMKDACNYTFISAKKLYVIPNISSFERSVKSDTTSHRIITIGRLSMQKGYDILIDIISEIKERLDDWVVDIFGSGEMENELIKKIKTSSLEKIVFIHPPTKNIREEFLNSGFYLMTSRHEGLPMVLIEAQTCGLPIVSFNCPEGPSEIITDRIDGFLVPMGDTKQMGERIVEMIRDVKMRSILGEKAYENSQRFSRENIAAKWSELFSSVEGR